MTIEERLREYILVHYGTVKEFATKADLPYGTVDTILRRGIHKASVTNVIAMCKTLGISADELANDRIVAVSDYVHSRSKLTDLDEIMRLTKLNLQEDSGLTINGEPMTKEELILLTDTLEIGIELIKRKRERKDK